MSKLDSTRLKEILKYDPETGEFKRKNGIKTGTINKSGYVVIKIKKLYYAHRLAWLYMYGDYPKNNVDHINGNPSDNRICNLRDGIQALNNQNKRKCISTNKSCGLLGVTYSKQAKKWIASIMLKRKRYHIGYFDTAQKAHEAYLIKKRELHEFCSI